MRLKSRTRLGRSEVPTQRDRPTQSASMHASVSRALRRVSCLPVSQKSDSVPASVSRFLDSLRRFSVSLCEISVPVRRKIRLGASRVTAERGGHGGQRAVDQWMQSHPISHAPDIIIRDYDGPNSFVLIDIKTFDAAGPAHIGAHHTDRARLTAHLAIAANSRRHQYGDIAPGMRLVIIAISTCGAINSEGIDFISHLARRSDNSIPLALLDQASWRRGLLPDFCPDDPDGSWFRRSTRTRCCGLSLVATFSRLRPATPGAPIFDSCSVSPALAASAPPQPPCTVSAPSA